MNILRKIREVDRALNEGLITYQEAADAVAPFTDAEPIRHGKWILKGVREPLPRDYPPCYGEDEYDEETHSIIVKHWFCSECDYDASDSFKPKDNYCPHCGAKMDEVMEEARTYSTNTDINPEPYKPAFILINPDAEKDYLLDGRYVVRAPKRGKWVYYKRMGYFCSACIESGLSPTNADDKCGYSLDGTMKYCWNCGAKMEE